MNTGHFSKNTQNKLHANDAWRPIPADGKPRCGFSTPSCARLGRQRRAEAKSSASERVTAIHIGSGRAKVYSGPIWMNPMRRTAWITLLLLTAPVTAFARAPDIAISGLFNGAALLTINGQPKMLRIGDRGIFRHVIAGRTVAVFALHIGKMRRRAAADKSARNSRPNGVARDAFRVVLLSDVHQGLVRTRVGCLRPG